MAGAGAQRPTWGGGEGLLAELRIDKQGLAARSFPDTCA